MESAWGVLKLVGFTLSLHNKPGMIQRASWHEAPNFLCSFSHLSAKKLFLGLTIGDGFRSYNSLFTNLKI